MADLASSDVAYTKQSDGFSSDMRYQAVFKLVFGNASLTYPSGGVPLLKASLGCAAQVEELVFLDEGAATGLVYKWDYTNNKIRIYRGAGFTPAGTNDAPVFTGTALAAHGHVLYVGTGATDAAGARVNAASNVLEMNNAGASIASIASATGNGGIVQLTAGTPAGTVAAPTFTGTAVAAANLIELVAATTAIASATTLYVRVRGF